MLLVKGLPSQRLKWLFPILITTALVYHFTRTTIFLPEKPQPQALRIGSAVALGEGLSPEEQYLARLSREFGLTNETEWLAWRIGHSAQAANAGAAGWSSVNQVRAKFGSRAAKVVDTEQPDAAALRVANRLELPVARSGGGGDDSKKDKKDNNNNKDFVFGVTTTYARVMDRNGALLKSWARWLTAAGGGRRSNGASLVIMLDQAESAQVKEVEQALRASGVDAQVSATGEPMSMARRYHELARMLKSFGAVVATGGGEIKRWFALVEDDVFFPDMAYLRERLARYVPRGQLYVGMPSERDDWEERWGEDGTATATTTTYGGGAVFLTRSALATLTQLSCFDVTAQQQQQQERFRAKRWDILLQDCLTTKTDLNMYVLPGFYNPTDDGDGETTSFSSSSSGEEEQEATSAYETGVRPLLLHRHLERHGLDVNMAHLVTNACGASCFMKRYVFQDDWVLVNGVSISQHFDKLEHHHRRRRRRDDDEEEEEEEERQSQRQQRKRPSLPGQIVIDDMGVDRTALATTQNRRVWRFVDSVMSDDGAVWQAYLNKASSREEQGGVDSVIVLVWEKDGSPPS